MPERSGISNPVEITDETTLEELFRIAMESELESEKFYRNTRERFDDQEVRRTLGFLAASERNHYETSCERSTVIELIRSGKTWIWSFGYTNI